MKIIDISKHNESIDFNAVKAAGVQGVMIRSSWGHFREDERFRENVQGCLDAGLPFGFYHYSYALNEEEAHEEVDGFLNLIKEYKPELPVAIDMEDADGYKAKNGTLYKKALNTTICDIFCSKCEEAGYYAMIYCNLDWTKTKLNMDDLARYDLWLARWGSTIPGRKCGMWQYTSDGSVGGISGRVDMNKAYIDYPAVIKENGLNGFGGSEQPEEPENDHSDEWGKRVELNGELRILWSDDINLFLGRGADDTVEAFTANRKYFTILG